MAIYIYTVMAAGGDYTSRNAADVGIRGIPGVNAAGNTVIINPYAFVDTTALSLNSAWAVDSLQLVVPVSERHVGKYNESKAIVKVANATAISSQAKNLTVIGDQYAVASATSTQKRAGYFLPGVATTINVSKCIFKGHGDAARSVTMEVGFYAAVANITFNFWDNIIYNVTSNASSGILFYGNATTHKLYVQNCTVSGGVYNLHVYQLGGSNPVFEVKNCILRAAGTAVSTSTGGGSLAATCNYNSSDKAVTTGGANDRTNQTFSFTDSGAGDFSLLVTDTGAKGWGVDLSGGVIGFNDDIASTARIIPWDMGAWKAPGAAAFIGQIVYGKCLKSLVQGRVIH